MILLQLFLMFVKLSLFSFGGGYVLIPIMLQELETNQWATAAEVTDIVAIAGMSPGPVAVNAAVGLGYHVAGVPGVIAAFMGIATPCAILVIVAATFFFKVYNHPIVKGALYGLGPVITSLILFAAVKLALENSIVVSASGYLIETGYNVHARGIHLFEVKSLVMAVAAFLILTKTKVHPIFVILGAGVLGLILF